MKIEGPRRVRTALAIGALYLGPPAFALAVYTTIRWVWWA